MYYGITQSANAHLQGAAVFHQCTGVKTQGIIGKVNGQLGCRKQSGVVARMVNHHIENMGWNHCAVPHEGQTLIHNPHYQVCATTGLQHAHQLNGCVGVTTE